MYGALTSLDRLGLFSAGRPLQSGQSEQHNVLPLTSCPSRFTLLPISTQPIRSSIQAPALQKSLYKAKVGGKYIEIQTTFKTEKLNVVIIHIMLSPNIVLIDRVQYVTNYCQNMKLQQQRPRTRACEHSPNFPIHVPVTRLGRRS